MQGFDLLWRSKTRFEHKKIRIAVVGAPASGKKALTGILAHTFCRDLFPVKHAASILFKGEFPIQSDGPGLESQERAIYYLQRELETIAEFPSSRSAILCNGGSFDCLAYVSKPADEFFRTVGSSLEAEILRYDWVIQLVTDSDDRISKAWSLHPNRIVLPTDLDFEEQTNVAIRCVSRILNCEPETKQIKHFSPKEMQ